MSSEQVSNIISGYDNSLTNPYQLFSFIDEPPNQYIASSFEDYMSSKFNDMLPYITSEDSINCNITTEDRNEFNTKLSKLNQILNKCNDPTIIDRNECVYIEFNKPDTIQTISDLIRIAQKINTECLFKNISGEDTTMLCEDQNQFILNNYSNSDLEKNMNFIKNYSNIIVQLKNIADTNLKSYLQKCGQTPERVQSYNDIQNVLAKALFETNICPKCPDQQKCPEPVYNKDRCMAVPEVQREITNLRTEKKELENEFTIIKSEKDKISEEYENILKESTFVWDASFSFKNGFVYFGFILILLGVIGLLAYLATTKGKNYYQSQPQYGIKQSRPGFTNS
jgi:hypothetical protein